ncbi:MAG TPA: glycosyl transferase [Nitrospiraceae bacterium]|nr:glycosyl transferase [Nitrospiraceae bacterium]
MNISIVIPVYGRTAWTGKCVEKMQEQGYRKCEIIIVDDGNC